MDRRTKSSLLWGLVGALAFLALFQGARLVVDLDVSLAVTALAVVLAGLGAALGTYVLEGVLASRNERP